ncbi:TolC family protein [Coraliomargarita sp. SDUM461004]|uniref:TolC family protein n=1 Tax=Thalassobacterium sedimentorum TaxID=3041258 RepID=A0ABU1AMI7_9BACT|nr:TolC family protein [Coraliomargarita sp. SDUM461004]MDQ8196001.1 TolC family protein [Coraliomargarita sp. SDUM461004]
MIQLTLGLVAANVLQAQTPASWDLSVEEAVFKALQNNRDLNIQQLTPVIAGAFEQIERGVYDPELYANFEYIEEAASETSRSTGEQFPVEGRDVDAELGLRQRLPFGTELEASVSSVRSISNRAPEQQQARYGLTVTQQLLRGFGAAVNLASLRQAKLETLASQYELAGFTLALVAEVESTYWNFVAATEAIKVFEQSVELAQAQLEDIQSRIEVGSLSQNQAAAAQAELALQQQHLIDAQSLRHTRLYELMRLIYPDLPLHAALPLQATSLPVVDVHFKPEAQSHIQLALQARPEIEASKLLRERDELETVVTRNGRLPQLELFVNLGHSGYADSFRRSVRENDGESYDYTLGFELSQFIGNRASRARDTIARASAEQADEALANLRSLVRYDVLLALNELERARKQVTASAVTREFRAQSLQAEEDRFEVGTGTSLDVARAQRDFAQSRIAEVQARVAYLMAKIELFRADGSLLERRGIKVESL